MNEIAFKSKIGTQFWNLFVLQRMQRWMDSKPAQFKRLDITNMVQLLKAIGVSERDMADALLGFTTLTQYHRRHLEDLFDESYLDRGNLKKEIEHVRRDLVGLNERQVFPVSPRNLKKRDEEIEETSNRLTELKTRLASLPKRNSVPENLFQYPSYDFLKRAGYIKQKNSTRWDLDQKGYNLELNRRQLRDSFVHRKDRTEELYLTLWKKMSSGLRNTLLQDLLGIIQRPLEVIREKVTQ